MLGLPPMQQSQPNWDQAGLIAALNQLSVQSPSPWVLDTGATSHMSSTDGILVTRLPNSHTFITVGNGHTIPVICRGTSFLPIGTTKFDLKNILVAPSLVRNLLSVRQFTRDNNCSIEFDEFGFSVKDLRTRRVILRCNSRGDLYTLPTAAPAIAAHSFLAQSSTLWHRRLGHPSSAAIQTLHKLAILPCTKIDHSLCHACQLGKHTRLPFSRSQSSTSSPFELVHCDVWTSPVLSTSGFKYYLVVLDDFSHFCWTFPLRHKSDVHQHIVEFVAYVTTQFDSSIKCFQADNGTEFVNQATTSFLASRGTLLRLSCPYTSPQNGKAERMLRTINNSIRTLLIQASMPPSYWAEALATATYLLNRRPSTSVHNFIPFQILHHKVPDYSNLRVFGCLCYPNLSATTPHKLSPRSAACVFLGYPASHKGYRCLDISTRRVFISRHVVFDEQTFPFAAIPQTASSFDFLLQGVSKAVAPSSLDVERPCSLLVAPSPEVEPPDDLAGPDMYRLLLHNRRLQSSQAPEPAILAPSSASCGADASTTGGSMSSSSPVQTILSSSIAQPPALHGVASARPLISPYRHTYVRRTQPVAVHGPIRTTRAFRAAQHTQDQQRHAMVTRSQTGNLRPVQRFNYTAMQTSVSPVPSNYRSALADPNWRAAMADEYKALVDNNTWRLVPRPPGANVVTGKWIFRHKFHSDGTLARHKARWVVRGYSQQHGIDYDETFSPVVKPATIRVVLSIAASRSWPIHQLDVKNAFLHGNLEETVYCQQPSGFVDPSAPTAVCLLQKPLYGLKQAPRAWYQRFATYIRQLGFTSSASDTSLFIYKDGDNVAYLLLYVDDILLTASSTSLLQHITARLHSEFAMTDLGDLHFFLGISVTRSSNGLFLSQRQYAVDLLRRAGMSECHPTATPVDARCKLSATDGAPVSDPTEYRSLAGALQYLTLTRPEIAYAVQQVCLFMHDPREPHLALVKRILRYIKGTLHIGLHIGTAPVDSLTAYSDAD